MPNSQDLNSDSSGSGNKVAGKSGLRPFISGIVPLFVVAHFGHHGVGAMMRPLLPMIRSDLGLNLTQAGYIMSAFTLTNGLIQLPAGWLADRLGARLMVLLSITGVAVAGFFIGFSNSFASLVIFLVLSAIMGGGYHPASVAAISASVAPEFRGRSLGVHLIGGTSAFWLIPLLVTPIAATWDWRMPFKTILVPIAILGIVLFVLIGRRTRAIAIEREKTGSEAPPDDTAIPWRKLVPFMVMSVMTGTMIMSTSSFLSFYAVDRLNVPETTIPLLMAITPGVGLFMAPLGGYLSDRFGSVRVILVLGFTAIPLVYLMGVTPNVPSLIALMIAIGLVTNTRMPTSESYIAGNTPERRRSTMLGIYFFAGTGVAGPLAPLIGNLIDRIGYEQTFAMASLATAMVTVVSALFIWKTGTADN
ncbi:MAG: MFS transporter [Dehalococcoidales bacterium]|jgi:MFS family permease|nr:MFS transporter [Dehalococcoidales bacterium]